MKTALSILYLVFVVISPAIAGDTAQVYKGGILTSVFGGVCALIVVAQLVPVLMLIVGFIKGSVAAVSKREASAQQAKER